MQPFLTIDGVELANANRTLSYLQDFGPPTVQVNNGTVFCEAVDTTMVATAPPSSVGFPGPLLLFGLNLSGTASEDEVMPIPYKGPALDPAPWYVASRPDSAAFLGFFLDSISWAPTFTRTTVQRSRGGASLGRLVAKGAVLACSGAMYAMSEAGMEWGYTWLDRVLAGSCGDACNLQSVCVLPACPDDGPPLYRRMVQAGVVDGPTMSPIQNMGGCWVRNIAFQIGSQSGYLFADPVVVGQGTGAVVAATISTDDWGNATTRITVAAGGPAFVGPITISSGPQRSGASPPVNYPATLSYSIPQLTPGTVLVIDGMTRSVTIRQQGSGQVAGGISALGGGQPLQWIDLGSCDSRWISVNVTSPNTDPATTVTIERIDREHGPVGG